MSDSALLLQLIDQRSRSNSIKQGRGKQFLWRLWLAVVSSKLCQLRDATE